MSYQIVGIAFKIFNENGYGGSEKHYQKLFANALEEGRIPFRKEQLTTLRYHNQPAGRYYLDFVVDDKIVVELKVRPKFGYSHIKQVMDYLRTADYRLAILVYFTRDGVKYRRVLNAV